MEYALVKNALVENVIVADEAFVAQIAADWDHIERIDTPAEQALGVGIGWGWTGTEFTAPPAPPAPEPAPPPIWLWFIDLGPFYDRFGAAKMAVLTSTDAGVKAIIADLNIRKWVDLQRADVATALAYVGSVVPAVTPALQTQILTTPVANEENLALRKVYFS
jgi:hypothetical protein